MLHIPSLCMKSRDPGRTGTEPVCPAGLEGFIILIYCNTTIEFINLILWYRHVKIMAERMNTEDLVPGTGCRRCRFPFS